MSKVKPRREQPKRSTANDAIGTQTKSSDWKVIPQTDYSIVQPAFQGRCTANTS